MSEEVIDRALTGAKVILVAGAGGVGKTTVAAALGLRAARRHDRRVVVVTVDPARRLADALGVSRLTEEPVLVPVGEGAAGRLWVVMVDMATSWDRLVTRHATSDEVRRGLLGNALYRTLTRRFVQSHDYIALDHLCDLADEDRYDLVIVDTPPSRHAIDLLDAPARMIEFFDSRLLRWLVSGAGAGLAAAPAKPFLLLAERLLGRRFMAEIVAFFTLFAELRPAFVDRARQVERRLGDPSTGVAVITSTEPAPVAEAGHLIDALGERRMSPDIVVVNRFEPTLRLDRSDGDGGPPTFVPRFSADDLSGIDDHSLRAALDEMQHRAEAAGRPSWSADHPVVSLPWRAGELDDLEGLEALLSDRSPVDG